MPLTDIEAYMFQGTMQHAVTAFSIEHDTVVVAIAPWRSETALSSPRAGYFHNARLTSREVLDDDVIEGLQPPLPWDIIGFDSYALGHDRWRFMLHCVEIEFVWESAWPVAQPGRGSHYRAGPHDYIARLTIDSLRQERRSGDA